MSIGQGSTVKNEEDKIVYKVKGSFLSNHITKLYKKKIKDENGKKLFTVRNKFWHKPFHKSAVIFNDKGKKLAVVTNSHLIKNGYEVVGATEPIQVEGRGWDLDIILGEKKIGHISLPEVKNIKDAMRISDAFVLDVEDPDDAPFLVAMMIAIDNIHDQERRK